MIGETIKFVGLAYAAGCEFIIARRVSEGQMRIKPQQNKEFYTPR
jgi:hypothetical protein